MLPNKPKFPITILINNKAIEVKYKKYLGVTLEALSFKYMMNRLKRYAKELGYYTNFNVLLQLTGSDPG